MASLWTDWRKTALGAVILVIFALLFTHEGGVAETAVSGAEELAGRKQEEIRAGAEAHKTWFASDESSYQVEAVAPPPRTAPQQAPPSPEMVQNPEPVGADFPAGLRPPA